jgi:hypothetical protein
MCHYGFRNLLVQRSKIWFVAISVPFGIAGSNTQLSWRCRRGGLGLKMFGTADGDRGL